MIKTLLLLARAGRATQRGMFPMLPEYSRGLPMLTQSPCADGCLACADLCPTSALGIEIDGGSKSISLDRGLCVACGGCVAACPSGTIASDCRTDIAVLVREELVLRTGPADRQPTALPGADEITGTQSGPPPSADRSTGRPFRRSLHVRVVCTGDSASDLEVVAAENPIFDAGRFGIQTVASPRFADALVVTGPVAHGMREPLLRCYEAMASPRMVVAVGASAISGGVYRGGYASANGVDSVLPVAAYVPGSPPHPWTILHGLLLAMGHPSVTQGK